MQIRDSIFETNSSSTHSFVIRPDKLINNEEYEQVEFKRKPKIMYIPTGGFGWGYEELSDWKDRASYLATYAYEINDQTERESAIAEFEEVMSKYLLVPVKIRWYENSHIDHQSLDVAEELFKDIINTVFRKNGVIIIDNDNRY